MDWVQWADLIFVMEDHHRAKLSSRYAAHLRGKKVVCLGIPDSYGYMDPELVKVLREKVTPYLPPGPVS